MLFEKKKIQIETLSEYLTSVRNNLKFSIQEVSSKTGIKPKFLAALESGEFKVLPADVYVLGFLRQLAQFYSIDGSVLIEQYKKEMGIHQQLEKQNLLLSSVWYKKYWQKLVITPKILSLAVGLLFVGVSVGYIIWQVWSINKTPSLQISQPADNTVIASSTVQVEGKTDAGMTVSVNDQSIFVDKNGGFQTVVSLSPGPKEIVVTVKNRFDRTVSKTINIIGGGQGQTATGTLELKIDFTGPVSLGIAVDDQPKQDINFNSGDTKTFTGQQKILLSTSDAGATKVTLNGQNLGALGRLKESLANITFSAQSANIK